MVRGTVEETLNAMLDAEADRLCGAGRYERSEARQDTRAGSYERTLHTKAGDVSLRIPKLRRPRRGRRSRDRVDAPQSGKPHYVAFGKRLGTFVPNTRNRFRFKRQLARSSNRSSTRCRARV